MIQINLLPWRQQARQAKKMRFLLSIGIAAGIAALLVLLLHFRFVSMLNYQERRNIYLQSQLDTEQRELTALNEDKRKILAGTETLQFLFTMRQNDMRLVKVLDHIAKAIPEGVSINRLSRKDKQLIIIGKASSNLAVTLLMKNIDNPTLYQQPELSEISAKELGTGEERFFQIKLVLNE
jgi:type IV pilus assembly protein PilN